MCHILVKHSKINIINIFEENYRGTYTSHLQDILKQFDLNDFQLHEVFYLDIQHLKDLMCKHIVGAKKGPIFAKM